MNRDDIHRQFNEDGYVKLVAFLDGSVVAQAQTAMEALVEQHARQLVAAGKNESTLSDEPFASRFFRLYENHLDDAPKSFRRELHLPGLFDLFFNPGLLDVGRTPHRAGSPPLSQLHRTAEVARMERD